MDRAAHGLTDAEYIPHVVRVLAFAKLRFTVQLLTSPCIPRDRASPLPIGGREWPP